MINDKCSISYIEQLMTVEWQNRRLEILRRDEFKCKHCQNSKIINSSTPGLIVHHYNNQSCTVFDLNSCKNFGAAIFDPTYKKENKSSQICYYGRVNDRYIVLGYLENLIPMKVNLSYSMSLEEDLEEDPKFWFDYYQADIAISILQNIQPEMLKWEYIFNMNVHHKYYKKGLMAWEYPNEALVSLCWNCHEELHENSTVPELDVSGNLINYHSRCPKCHGAGWLPHYQHVENGICFNCNGLRFK